MVAGPTVEGWRSARAYILAALGRTEEAAAELAPLVDGLARTSWTVGWLTHRCGEALAAALIGDQARARVLAEALMPLRDHLCIDVIASMGPVAYAAGRALVTAGEIELGRELLEQAVAQCRDGDAPRWEARASSALDGLP